MLLRQTLSQAFPGHDMARIWPSWEGRRRRTGDVADVEMRFLLLAAIAIEPVADSLRDERLFVLEELHRRWHRRLRCTTATNA